MRKQIQIKTITFSYNSILTPVFEKISATCASGWTGIVGKNGSGKSTFLKLITQQLKPDSGIIELKGEVLYCPQRTDNPALILEDFLISKESSALKIKNLLKIENHYCDNWNALSHGEKKRTQLAIALWINPNILAIDEPTNHLDYLAKQLIINSLKNYKGIGLIVSHDRLLLDTLCYQCLFIKPPNIIIRPGGVSNGLEQEKIENINKKREFIKTNKKYKRLYNEMNRRKNIANKQDKKKSKKGLAKKDHDAKSKIDLARLSGKDGAAGKRFKQIESRVKQAEQKLFNTKKADWIKTGIWISGSLSKRDYLLKVPKNEIILGNNKKLIFPDLIMNPSDKIALTGLNGTGKSTLIKYLLKNLNLDLKNVIYLPQEVSIEKSKIIINEVKELNHDKLGQIMIIISRLGSDPKRLLQTNTPSPGEIRKLILALGILKDPHLIIMDEPTNHLDIIAMKCFEEALSNCPCGLLLISHDDFFLNVLTKINWKINDNKNKTSHILSCL